MAHEPFIVNDLEGNSLTFHGGAQDDDGQPTVAVEAEQLGRGTAWVHVRHTDAAHVADGLRAAAGLPPADRAADEVDADTVADRATQVITAMGADIRALTGQRDRYRTAWQSACFRAKAFGEGILRHVADRDSWQRQYNAEHARHVAVVGALVTDRAAVRAETFREAADAVLQASHGEPLRDAYSAHMRNVGLLRRMAVEAEQDTASDLTERLERGRAQLLEAMSAVSEDRTCTGWASDWARTLHAEGGIWETLGRAVGWPTGNYDQWVWVSWDEAATLYGATAP